MSFMSVRNPFIKVTAFHVVNARKPFQDKTHSHSCLCKHLMG